MFGLGMPELVISLVVLMVFFGGGKLSELARGIGKTIRNFKKATIESDTIDVTQKLRISEDRSVGEEKTAGIITF